MVTHLRREDGTNYCGEEGDAITLEEATSGEEHFDCVNCHKVLSDNQRHSRPPEEESE